MWGRERRQETLGSCVVATLWLILKVESRFSTLLKCAAEVRDPEESQSVNR